MNLQVTPATAADRGPLLALLAAQMVEHDIDIAETSLGAAIDGALADPRRGHFLVARVDGRPVGVAYLSMVWAIEHGGLSSWLEELYVLPALREQGIGGRLLAAAMDHMRALGCAAIDLEVEASHARVAGLYQRHGFRAHTRARWVLPLR